MDARDNQNRQLFLGIGIGAALVLIVLVALSVMSGGSNGGDDGVTREPSADPNPILTEVAETQTAVAILSQTSTPTSSAGEASTATFTPTSTTDPNNQTPVVEPPTAEPDVPTPTATFTQTPEPMCDPQAIQKLDPGCVTSERDEVSLSKNGSLQPLPTDESEFLDRINNVHVNSGKAIINFFGGTLFVEKGSDIQIEDTSGISGVIFFLINRGSLVGEFEGEDEDKLEFKLPNGAIVTITGTQFFIDVKSIEDQKENDPGDDPAEAMFSTLNGRAVIGNLDGGVEIIQAREDGQEPLKLPPGSMTFLDQRGEFARKPSGETLIVQFPDISLKDLDELNRGSYLISLEDVDVRNGPAEEYDVIGSLLQGRFVEILGRDRRNGWFEVACEDMDKVADSKQCWIESDSAEIYPVNTDIELLIIPPLYPPPTPEPTVIPLEIPNLIFPKAGDVLLQNPKAESKLCNGIVELEWEAVSRATYYELNILHLEKTGGSETYSWSPFRTARVTTSSKTGTYPLELNQCEMICWQVQAFSGERESGFSSYNNFYFEIEASAVTNLAEVGITNLNLYACPRIFREIDVIKNPDLINPVIPIVGTPVFTLPGD